MKSIIEKECDSKTVVAKLNEFFKNDHLSKFSCYKNNSGNIESTFKFEVLLKKIETSRYDINTDKFEVDSETSSIVINVRAEENGPTIEVIYAYRVYFGEQFVVINDNTLIYEKDAHIPDQYVEDHFFKYFYKK